MIRPRLLLHRCYRRGSDVAAARRGLVTAVTQYFDQAGTLVREAFMAGPRQDLTGDYAAMCAALAGS